MLPTHSVALFVVIIVAVFCAVVVTSATTVALASIRARVFIAALAACERRRPHCGCCPSCETCDDCRTCDCPDADDTAEYTPLPE